MVRTDSPPSFPILLLYYVVLLPHAYAQECHQKGGARLGNGILSRMQWPGEDEGSHFCSQLSAFANAFSNAIGVLVHPNISVFRHRNRLYLFDEQVCKEA